MLRALILLSAAVWLPQPSGSDAELRGLAALDARHAWASGAAGTVLRTRDGTHWEKLAVPGGEKLDFRDLDAPDSSAVFLMSAGTGEASRIYKSTDGGAAWTLVHTNPDPDGFYDAIAFWDSRYGLLVGDPVRRALSGAHDRRRRSDVDGDRSGGHAAGASGRGRLRGQRHLPDRLEGRP